MFDGVLCYNCVVALVKLPGSVSHIPLRACNIIATQIYVITKLQATGETPFT